MLKSVSTSHAGGEMPLIPWQEGLKWRDEEEEMEQEVIRSGERMLLFRVQQRSFHLRSFATILYTYF